MRRQLLSRTLAGAQAFTKANGLSVCFLLHSYPNPTTRSTHLGLMNLLVRCGRMFGGGRRPGAGRPRLTDSDPELLGALEALVDPDTRGDPESPLRWSSKSLQKLAGALQAAGHQVSDRTTGKLLRGLGFRLHANRKTREGKDHPDRDGQFRHINETTRSALAADQPVISVDTKKRELGVPRTQSRRLDVEVRAV
jgi:hypothetical protein